MDTLTHALSGALLARLIARRQALRPIAEPAAGRLSAPWDRFAGAPLPWQCTLAGAAAAAFPDIDFVVGWFGDIAYLTQHRGVTHSLLLLPAWALAVAWLLSKCFATTRHQPGGWKSFYVLAAAGIALHIAGDWITQFGTMLLQPLSSQRFGLGAMFIIDLAFSGIFVVGLLLAALFPRHRWPAALGLAAAVLWVGIAWTGRQEALAAGERRAGVLGIRTPVVEVMPRPASPFNWTVAVFDGTSYQVAHINTRRTEPLAGGPDANFIRRYSAPYQPEPMAEWQAMPRFGPPGSADWVQRAWGHASFGFFRWFALTPVLFDATDRALGDGQRERCAWFRDLRFDFPGRDDGPFRYGVCFIGDDESSARVYRLEGGQRRPI